MIVPFFNMQYTTDWSAFSILYLLLVLCFCSDGITPFRSYALLAVLLQLSFYLYLFSYFQLTVIAAPYFFNFACSQTTA